MKTADFSAGQTVGAVELAGFEPEVLTRKQSEARIALLTWIFRLDEPTPEQFDYLADQVPSEKQANDDDDEVTKSSCEV